MYRHKQSRVHYTTTVTLQYNSIHINVISYICTLPKSQIASPGGASHCGNGGYGRAYRYSTEEQVLAAENSSIISCCQLEERVYA